MPGNIVSAAQSLSRNLDISAAAAPTQLSRYAIVDTGRIPLQTPAPGLDTSSPIPRFSRSAAPPSQNNCTVHWWIKDTGNPHSGTGTCSHPPENRSRYTNPHPSSHSGFAQSLQASFPHPHAAVPINRTAHLARIEIDKMPNLFKRNLPSPLPVQKPSQLRPAPRIGPNYFQTTLGVH
jgi:hypothetical protein